MGKVRARGGSRVSSFVCIVAPPSTCIHTLTIYTCVYVAWYLETSLGQDAARGNLGNRGWFIFLFYILFIFMLGTALGFVRVTRCSGCFVNGPICTENNISQPLP